MTDTKSAEELVSGWSCDERNRAACRNGHGCHCREITALRSQAGAEELAEFFRGEGHSRFGWNGDEMDWSPERTAIEAMRELMKISQSSLPQPGAVDGVREPTAWRWRNILSSADHWSYAAKKPEDHPQYITEPMFSTPTAAPSAERGRLPRDLTGEISCILEDCSPPEQQTPEAIAALIKGYQPTWDRILRALSANQPVARERE